MAPTCFRGLHKDIVTDDDCRHQVNVSLTVTMTDNRFYVTGEKFERRADYLEHRSQYFSLGHEKGPRHCNMDLQGAFRVGTTRPYCSETALISALREHIYAKNRCVGWI